MTYKLIISDLDHTLLREDHTLSEATIAAVRRCLESGIAVTLATGRRLPSALPYARQLGLTLPVITCQGAMLSTLDGQILHQCLMAPATGAPAFKPFDPLSAGKYHLLPRGSDLCHRGAFRCARPCRMDSRSSAAFTHA